MAINKDLQIMMLQNMLKIRNFEEKVKELFQKGLIRGSTHSYIGQEAVAVGVCSALKESDYVVSTHRGHGHCIAKGVDIKLMMAELLGKETGCCRGRGGSMHIADIEKGVLGASGIVASGIPIATGAGLSSKYLNTGQVAVSFFGDGASNNGTFHECLNLAAIWKLPVIFICENNLYAITVSTELSTSVENISIRSNSYGIPGETLDGNNVIDVYQAAKKAIERARKNLGPTLLEFKTYRFEGHWIGDPNVYRTQSEIDEWKKKDPILKFRDELLKDNIMDEGYFNKLLDEVKIEINEAEKFALECPIPLKEKVMDDIFS
ncbi:MAG: thiamine pyrophosphate-dependent dehydrogenase E1 component subunit alpha [Actinobacteria bacterium]|nr:thiamine pyrophosphate-dependent dehydrogenase E1 component subunit alpha [Actinomycetota bacterium]